MAMDGAMEKSKIQTLYEACSVVFSQKRPPSFQQVECLKNLLGKFEAKDVGIDEFGISCGAPSSSPNETEGLICGQGISEITYIHIHTCEDFSICVFCFPAGGTIPLHDHPGMTVFTKVLYGSIYAKSYDWVLKVDGSSTSKTWGVAATVRDEISRAPCETGVLYPTSGGNIHSFTALTPCAILDVQTPPYAEELGRPCTYFSQLPIKSLPGRVLLEERDLPGDLVVSGAPYLGPQLDTDDDFC